MNAIAYGLALVALLGWCGAVIGVALTARFRRQPALPPHGRPAVSILKPLYGDEPALERALASFGVIAYPQFQLVLGVQDPADPALAVVERVRRRYPNLDLVVVADARVHGPNRKVSNLVNMLPAARHDVLVFSDSDLHVGPDYLDHLVAALGQPGCGLVTTVCRGQAMNGGRPTLAARLGAMHFNHLFLPAVLMSRWLGREDGLGTTMAIHRHTLARTGGLDRLLTHLADDHVLGQRVRALGLSIGLAATMPVASVTERSFAALWQHELRWARTIRALQPGMFAGSLVQFPLFWAALACVASQGASWALALFAAGWVLRAVCGARIDTLTGAVGGWRETLLWPLRDGVSAALVVASFCGSRVVWRGHVMHADAGDPRAVPPLAYADAAD